MSKMISINPKMDDKQIDQYFNSEYKSFLEITL
jgi:hypothetical protein